MKKILVVDDESDICLTLANVLGGDRFVVHTFDDPLLALENFRKDSYDLLIIDIKMEKMNGLELYKASNSFEHADNEQRTAKTYRQKVTACSYSYRCYHCSSDGQYLAYYRHTVLISSSFCFCR